MEGANTEAAGGFSHVSGYYNVADSVTGLTEWAANTSYSAGDRVKVTTVSGSTTTVRGYRCVTANSDSEFTEWKWLADVMNYIEIVGNGTTSDARSNARTLDWQGNERLRGNLYVNCNADSTGGSKVMAEPSSEGTSGQVLTTDGNGGRTWTTVQGGSGTITDVQVNSTSVVTSGVANVPLASESAFGVIKVGYGLSVGIVNGKLGISKATDSDIKSGANEYYPIVPKNQHTSVFYALAKAAGDSTQASSSNAVGTYTDGAKTAIRTMIGAGTGTYSKPSGGIPLSDLASGAFATDSETEAIITGWTQTA